MRLGLWLAFLQLTVVGCGGDGLGPPPPQPPPAAPSPELGCQGSTDVVLSPGQASIVSAGGSAGCLRLTSGSTAAEYLVVGYSAAGDRIPGGRAEPYQWRARSPIATAAPAGAPSAAPPQSADPAERFHENLRVREAALAIPARGRRPHATATAAPPSLGSRRSFDVCSNVNCSELTAVPTTAAFVGRRVAIFVDDVLPPDGFTPEDFSRLGTLFDAHIYPGDTTAFGRESDVDSNGVVFLVMTKQINRLCFDVGGIVTGYFFGRDLIASEQGSNGAEVFFSLVPDFQGTAGCRVTKDFVERVLPPTFAHELQHMISYNQHVLVKAGASEETWLNEGLSHLAEELAGRIVPNGFCVANDCVSQFTFNDVSNAYRYLQSPDDWFLVYPSGSTGRLAERGAAWLLTRWLLDHFGGTTALTRRLLATAETGAANIASVTGQPFEALLGEWHLANYLDDLPNFTPANPRLRYPSWNWRVTFPSLRAQFPTLYPRSFPLAPDSTGGRYDYSGTLRGGSGRYLRIQITAGGPPVDFRLSDLAGNGLAAEVAARVAVVRIR